ncbi:MAG: DUF2382 domain-containing protein [Chroococcales cyanobacterium]
MGLYKIEDFNPNYRTEIFEGKEIKRDPVYAGKRGDKREKIGTVSNMLIDETGRIRYLVIDPSSWNFTKKVLLPIGRCCINLQQDEVYATGLTDRKQVENLPEYHESMTIDRNYEESVRGVYRMPTVENSVPVEMTPPVEGIETQAVSSRRPVANRRIDDSDINYCQPESRTTDYRETVHRNIYYDQEPELYEVTEQNHGVLKLYEERLVASKHRHKIGEVRVGKHVETETGEASVPVEKDEVIIERHPSDTQVSPGQADFHQGEVQRMEVYEETANINKEPVVSEEVDVRKEVKRDTVEAQETVRREELDINTTGNRITQENKRV